MGPRRCGRQGGTSVWKSDVCQLVDCVDEVDVVDAVHPVHYVHKVHSRIISPGPKMNLSTFQALRELSSGAALPLRIRGGCMVPALDDGASVLVRARRFYLPGDVLVFRTNAGDLAAHRMLGWRRAALVTKGDGCEIHDAPVAPSSILGAVEQPVRIRDRVRALGHFAGIVARRMLRQ